MNRKNSWVIRKGKTFYIQKKSFFLMNGKGVFGKLIYAWRRLLFVVSVLLSFRFNFIPCPFEGLLVLLHSLVVDLITGSHGLVQLFIRHLSHKSPQPLQFSCQLPSHPKQFISYQSIYKHWINIKKVLTLPAAKP